MNSKEKGGRFERKVARDLSKLWSDGKRDDLFWRSQSSGGRHTIRAKKGLVTEGQAVDIASTSKETAIFSEKVIVECKHYKEINLWDLITGSEETGLRGWWNGTKEIGLSERKHPILIAKQNYRPELFICESTLTCNLKEYITLDIKAMFLDKWKDTVDIYLFEDILKCSSESFKDMINIIGENNNA